ncbi:mechanosensitive ion channel protein MscS [Isoptericola cucumis]|uniref:Uncharacterized protein n=1 Tax=Isoptericola cucumis TaxID=1776856 RepID=A0ABQ2B871_9MICO|nr:mechanosensitive ion channel protein MscS [Isoptericola cucumis]GGI10302.1 hypothetical protein GCM10007368_30560 [Isoptericola cucumis]
MSQQTKGPIVIPSARTGRPPTRLREHCPDDAVRIDTQIPASLAERIYRTSRELGRPVRVVMADVLRRGFAAEDGDRMV